MTKEEYLVKYKSEHKLEYDVYKEYFKQGDCYLKNPVCMCEQKVYEARLKDFDDTVKGGYGFGFINRYDNKWLIKDVVECSDSEDGYKVIQYRYVRGGLYFESPNRFGVRNLECNEKDYKYTEFIDYINGRHIYFTDKQRNEMRELYAKANMKALGRYMELNIINDIGYNLYGLA